MFPAAWLLWLVRGIGMEQPSSSWLPATRSNVFANCYSRAGLLAYADQKASAE
jgi:hypothetical protein